MLPKSEIKKLKEELDNCKNPLFFYDSDGDGLCSFLLFYRYKREGHGIIVKARPYVDEFFLKSVEKYKPDKIFVLDTHSISEEFIEKAKVPIIHVDHHLRDEKIHGVKTFNPRFFDKDDNSPTSSICYHVVKQDLWLGAAGTIGDWRYNEVVKAFSKENPDLMDKKLKDPGEILYKTKIGFLSRLIDFTTREKTEDVKIAVMDLIKITSPEEILEQTTEAGKTVYENAMKTYSRYKEIYEQAEKEIKKDKLLVFIHPRSPYSFAGELANELVFNHPDKVVLVAREHSDEMKLSIRSATIEIRTKVLKALKGIEGTGGGHERAVGGNVKTADFDRFVEQFKAQLNI